MGGWGSPCASSVNPNSVRTSSSTTPPAPPSPTHSATLRGRTVIEIGPGHGAITSILAARCPRLIAIELDRALVTELQLHFRHAMNVEVLEADILKTRPSPSLILPTRPPM